MEGLAVKAFVEFMRKGTFKHGEGVNMVFSAPVKFIA
jgi:hypothetical protein